MKDVIVRHLISFLVTFLATFLLLLYPAIEVGHWEAGIFVGVLFASARSAFKVAWEFAIVPLLHLAIEFAKKKLQKN